MGFAKQEWMEAQEREEADAVQLRCERCHTEMAHFRMFEGSADANDPIDQRDRAEQLAQQQRQRQPTSVLCDWCEHMSNKDD